MSTIKKSYAQDYPGRINAFTFKKKHPDQPFLQPKLSIAPVDDVYEREADTMADKIVNGSLGVTTEEALKISPVPLQRKCAAFDEESFLNRAPGSSLNPVQFSDPANPIVDSFTNSWAIADDQDEILEVVSNRLNRLWFTLRPYTTTLVSLSNFLSSSEMNSRPVNFSNPFSIAGHIAGGIGSSDAGDDYRNIIRGNVTLQKIPLIGSAHYISISTSLKYEIFDTLDFCPGQCGSTAEQLFTISLSRLEAGGQAYDVPFKVTFFAPSRTTRKFFV